MSNERAEQKELFVDDGERPIMQLRTGNACSQVHTRHTWRARSRASASDARNQFSELCTCQQVNLSTVPSTTMTFSFCNSLPLRVCV